MKRSISKRWLVSALVSSVLLCQAHPAMAIRQGGDCPMSHAHMAHGMDMDMSTTDMSNMKMPPSDGESLAVAECVSCHGKHGMSRADDVPNLAGQTAMYLCSWLAGCRAEGAKCESHEDIAAKLTDQNIMDLTEFFAHMPNPSN